MNNTLYLNLTRGWFDLIKLGIKKVEYRQYKDYYCKRLMNKDGSFKRFTRLHLQSGYSSSSPRFYADIINISIVEHLCWGKVFAIELGAISDFY